MAIVCPCSLSVDEYIAAERNLEVPRPDCPDCQLPMKFRSGYQRWIRVAGICHRIWIGRAQCRPCKKGHALIPSFGLVRRLDVVETVGETLTAVVSGQTGVRPVAERLGVPHTTARDWVRRFRRRSERLGAGFASLSVLHSGVAPRVEGDISEQQALSAMVVAFVAVRSRAGEAASLGIWAFCSVVTGGGFLASTTDPPWFVTGKRRFMPPIP
jgi:transposase-like protein